jgi:hypothetical protein
VSDEALVDGVWDLYGDAFGEMQVMPAPVAVEGVDLQITLGRDYLRKLGESGSAAPDAPDDVAGDGAASETTDVTGSVP